MKAVLLLLLISGMLGFGAERVEKLSMSPAKGMTRADLYYFKTISTPKAVLVLCPGSNGNGEFLIRQPDWQEFAKKNRLCLVGLSFASASTMEEDQGSYYHASKGSGQKLLDGIERIYGRKLPLLFYGFSGGAHFTSRFEAWNPQAVMAWCAYSAGWWDEPVLQKTAPPGIVACGEDDPRYGASLIYFKQGRAKGKPWLWVGLSKTGHTASPELDTFVRQYFEQILKSARDPIWVDVDTHQIVSSESQEKIPSITGWLPSKALLDAWLKVPER